MKKFIFYPTCLLCMFMTASCDKTSQDQNEEEPGKTPSSVKLTQTSVSLFAGETFRLEAETSPADAKVTWTSDAEAFATVDENGLVTAIEAGNATITASIEGASATCAVTVTPPVQYL